MKAKFLATVIALVFVLAACSSETNKDIEITEVWITLPDGIRLASARDQEVLPRDFQ